MADNVNTGGMSAYERAQIEIEREKLAIEQRRAKRERNIFSLNRVLGAFAVAIPTIVISMVTVWAESNRAEEQNRTQAADVVVPEDLASISAVLSPGFGEGEYSAGALAITRIIFADLIRDRALKLKYIEELCTEGASSANSTRLWLGAFQFEGIAHRGHICNIELKECFGREYSTLESMRAGMSSLMGGRYVRQACIAEESAQSNQLLIDKAGEAKAVTVPELDYEELQIAQAEIAEGYFSTANDAVIEPAASSDAEESGNGNGDSDEQAVQEDDQRDRVTSGRLGATRSLRERVAVGSREAPVREIIERSAFVSRTLCSVLPEDGLWASYAAENGASNSNRIGRAFFHISDELDRAAANDAVKVFEDCGLNVPGIEVVPGYSASFASVRYYYEEQAPAAEQAAAFLASVLKSQGHAEDVRTISLVGYSKNLPKDRFEIWLPPSTFQ